MLEVSFEQVLVVGTAIGGTLVGAISFLVKWVLDQVGSVRDELKDCKAKHETNNEELLMLNVKCVRLETQVSERKQFMTDLKETVRMLLEANTSGDVKQVYLPGRIREVVNSGSQGSPQPDEQYPGGQGQESVRQSY